MADRDTYARAIIAEGQRRGIAPEGIVIALAVALVESNLTMYANPADPETLAYPHDALSTDYDSSGLFQQRPRWWGGPADRMDPARSAGLFYAALARLDYTSGAHSPGWYAQQIQQSAYPNRYDERIPDAQALYDRLTESTREDTPLGEHILPYDRNTVPQETGYWCGPASTQIVLNSRGIDVPEAQLAAEIGTTWNGTDYVGLITPVLNRYTGGGYVERYMPNDPPGADETEQLWHDIVASINAGYGVVANIVAPPDNYPRGVKGSISPAYAGGTVYHYVAIMGFDDTADRAVWIADSGFRPFGYWCSFDQIASLIPPKGYTANLSAPDGEETALSEIADIIRQELTYQFPSRVEGSDYRDTLVGYTLNNDKKLYDIEQWRPTVDAQLAALNTKLDRILNALEAN
ncbi:C39 family peptidase [Nocardia transvalensis]|uniref:C39 family peptidase n=1 Tax=Nocardia transvalensis TaxID=37333 RepID=UPI002B4B7A76|nr:C39 family peptidase [Nocardia transvalensis]